MKAFENASQAFKLANPRLVAKDGNKNAVQGNVAPRRGIMNKTEAEFALRLEAQKRGGEILRYQFEGIRLKWGVDPESGKAMHYTPDFVVFPAFPGAPPVMIEVKGGHIRDRDIVRFKGARAFWPEFGFQMHQKTKQGWKRILYVG